MNAEIIGIGTEILLGEITDTNSAYIARQLRDIGVNLFYIGAVGDNLERITHTLQQSLTRSDLIITTGGLGPTVDDMTRQAVADATGQALEFHQSLLDEIAERFRQYGARMSDNNRIQAMIPQGATIIHNPVGTAPCFIVETEQGTIISLPGVPREMKYLMEHAVLPYLRANMGLPAIIKAKVLRATGIGESALDELVGEYMKEANPTVGLAAHSGQVDIRITARADTEAEANAMIATMEVKIRAVTEQYIFGVDGASLDEAVLHYMSKQGVQFALLETGTHGIIANRYQQSDYAHVLKLVEQYATLDDLRQHYQQPDLALPDLANTLTQQVREAHGVDIAITLLSNGVDNALSISTAEKTSTRHMQMGGDDLLQWAGNWGMSFIWGYLRDKEFEGK